MSYLVVHSLALNLRSGDDPDRRNVIAVLPQGTRVRKLAIAPRRGWIEVEALLGADRPRGYVNASYLSATRSAPEPPATAHALPRADLGRSASATRAHGGSRAHALGETSRPGLPSTDPTGGAAGILRAVDWCAVENREHRRWWPAGGQTFCNIYAYDVITLCGAYLPRVWWTSQAIARLQAGERVPVQYASTVSELAANALYQWLVEHGPSFGWLRHYTPDDVQIAANVGRIALICAQRRNLNSPGHIQLVVPEHGEHTARRVAGKVSQPLQSNAGSRNFRYGQLGTSWWQGEQFGAFGFWSADCG